MFLKVSFLHNLSRAFGICQICATPSYEGHACKDYLLRALQVRSYFQLVLIVLVVNINVSALYVSMFCFGFFCPFSWMDSLQKNLPLWSLVLLFCRSCLLNFTMG